MDEQADILIVDDTVANLKILSTILIEENYKVRPAKSGALALAAVNQRPPDLIILDIKMPDMDGYEVCKILKKKYFDTIPIIFISALGEIPDKVKAFSMGGSDYIIKPFQPEEVKARVSTHLKVKRYQDKMEDMIAKALADINDLNYEIIDTQRELLCIINDLCESKSQETGQHVKRVSEFSYLFAKLAGCDGEEAEMIKHAAPMHDIGKIGIPDTILNKPTKLNDEEWAIMQTHPTIGYKALCSSKRPLIAMAATIAHEHHEKWDGSGYPRKLKGEKISIAGRVVACADVFDALGCGRCYKEAWNIEQIIAYFSEQKGKHFDPNLVDLLTKNIDQFLEIKSQH